jgi:hypothetical protein
MVTTIIGIVIAALAIEADRKTGYRHHILPIIALVGIAAAMVSFTL